MGRHLLDRLDACGQQMTHVCYLGHDGNPPFVNLKCDPDRAIELRGHYEAVQPGWHMNKQQWNSVYYTGNIPDELVRELIDHSYFNCPARTQP